MLQQYFLYITQVDPMDAGTDKGLTFSSPNWAEDPNIPISAMTSSSPEHPAASFFYPEMNKLPAIAEFNFLRVKHSFFSIYSFFS